jgi:hypothetical protein
LHDEITEVGKSLESCTANERDGIFETNEKSATERRTVLIGR